MGIMSQADMRSIGKDRRKRPDTLKSAACDRVPSIENCGPTGTAPRFSLRNQRDQTAGTMPMT